MNELDQLRAEADQLKNAIRVSKLSTIICYEKHKKFDWNIGDNYTFTIP